MLTISVIGTGAIGGYYGAKLTAAVRHQDNDGGIIKDICGNNLAENE